MINLDKTFNQLHDLKEAVLRLLSYRFAKIYLALCLFLNILLWALTFNVKSKISEDLVILHYNVDFGVNLIGNSWKIINLPLVGLIFIITNIALILMIQKQDRLLAHLLFGTALLCNFFLLFNLGLIYLVNLR